MESPELHKKHDNKAIKTIKLRNRISPAGLPAHQRWGNHKSFSTAFKIFYFDPLQG